jgi:hypothetical protein
VVPISELCDKHGLQPSVFYRRQKEFFENGLMVILLPPRYTGTGGILGMIGFYMVAKILELFDRQIGAILPTGGHPWKHIAGALAILCYVNTVARRQNAVHEASSPTVRPLSVPSRGGY